jgi:hypothetical protein
MHFLPQMRSLTTLNLEFIYNYFGEFIASGELKNYLNFQTTALHCKLSQLIQEMKANSGKRYMLNTLEIR